MSTSISRSQSRSWSQSQTKKSRSYSRRRPRRGMGTFQTLLLFMVFVGAGVLLYTQKVKSTPTDLNFKTQTPCQPKVDTISNLTSNTPWLRTEIDFQTNIVSTKACPPVPVYFREDGAVELGFSPWKTVLKNENGLVQRRECSMQNISDYDSSYQFCNGNLERTVYFGPWDTCSPFGKQTRLCSIEDACTENETERPCTPPVSKLWVLFFLGIIGTGIYLLYVRYKEKKTQKELEELQELINNIESNIDMYLKNEHSQENQENFLNFIFQHKSLISKARREEVGIKYVERCVQQDNCDVEKNYAELYQEQLDTHKRIMESSTLRDMYALIHIQASKSPYLLDKYKEKFTQLLSLKIHNFLIIIIKSKGSSTSVMSILQRAKTVFPEEYFLYTNPQKTQNDFIYEILSQGMTKIYGKIINDADSILQIDTTHWPIFNDTIIKNYVGNELLKKFREDFGKKQNDSVQNILKYANVATYLSNNFSLFDASKTLNEKLETIVNQKYNISFKNVDVDEFNEDMKSLNSRDVDLTKFKFCRLWWNEIKEENNSETLGKFHRLCPKQKQKNSGWAVSNIWNMLNPYQDEDDAVDYENLDS